MKKQILLICFLSLSLSSYAQLRLPKGKASEKVEAAKENADKKTNEIKSVVKVPAPEEFFAESTEKCREFTDRFLAMTEYDYEYQDALPRKDLYHLVYARTDENGDKSHIIVTYRVRNIGGNEALEVKGTDEYHFYMIHGRFLDIFPFWKKYIDPTAAKETIAEKNETWHEVHFVGNAGSSHFRFGKQENIYGKMDWRIARR